jgi:hypothetical protein
MMLFIFAGLLWTVTAAADELLTELDDQEDQQNGSDQHIWLVIAVAVVLLPLLVVGPLLIGCYYLQAEDDTKEDEDIARRNARTTSASFATSEETFVPGIITSFPAPGIMSFPEADYFSFFMYYMNRRPSPSYNEEDDFGHASKRGKDKGKDKDDSNSTDRTTDDPSMPNNGDEEDGGGGLLGA